MTTVSTPIWTIHVDEVELCSRIEAYYETKEQIAVFESIHLPLPPEIVSAIGQALFHDAYSSKKLPWLSFRRCRTDKCDAKVHLAPKEQDDLTRFERELDAIPKDKRGSRRAEDLETDIASLKYEAKVHENETVNESLRELNELGKQEAVRNSPALISIYQR